VCDGAADFTTRIRSLVWARVLSAREFIVHQRKLQTERDWLGMHTVAAPISGHLTPRLLRSLFAKISDRPREGSHDSFNCTASVVIQNVGRG